MIGEIAKEIKNTSLKLAGIDSQTKNNALKKIAENLIKNKDEIIIENKKDLDQNNKISKSLYERLKLDEKKIVNMSEGILSLVKLEDPVNKTLFTTELDDGLTLYKVSSPIGVIGVIFESRPDALVQISSLCIKSGNAALLKGGSEAINTNRCLMKIIQKSISEFVPEKSVILLETRDEVKEMLLLDEYIDLIIPRGSNALVKYIKENTKIPVMGHADGICHVYLDEKYDEDIALKVIVDSKVQYPAVCNATETLLINENVSNEFIEKLIQKLKNNKVEVRGCEKLQKIVDVKPATEDDWKTEYNELILSVKIVPNFDEAVEHISKYSSGHTECIITKDEELYRKFASLVDSSSVMYNCSTRFADGFRYGFGAEVGISTHKIHARGPVGLEGLVIYKYHLMGNGHIVDDYAKGIKNFKHKKIEKKY